MLSTSGAPRGSRAEACELFGTDRQSGPETSADATSASPRTRHQSPPQHAHSISLSGLLVLAAGIALLATLVIPKLPRGACFDDCGDLQWACLTLGTAHDPGYAGLVTLGWLVTKAPLLDPLYAVTLACSLSGLFALALCAVLQVRAGARPLLATAVVLIASLHPAVRDNLVVPEVYAPSAALTLAALLAVQSYSHTGRTRSVCIAALLLGLATGSRPSIVLMLPGFAIAFAVAARSHARNDRVRRHVAWAAACFAIPCVFSVAFLWLREPGQVPDHVPTPVQSRAAVDGSTGGRTIAVLRCLTGADYTFKRTSSWSDTARRAVWVATNAMPAGAQLWLSIVLPLAIVGGVRTARRDPALAWGLAGVAAGNVALLELIQTGGTAADYLPLVLVTTMLAGIGLAGFRALRLNARLSAIRIFVVIVSAAATLRGWTETPAIATEIDAVGFLSRLGLAAQPADTVVLAPWFEATAIRVARTQSGRRDIRIVPSDNPLTEPAIARWLGDSADQLTPVIAVGQMPDAIERALDRRPNAAHVLRASPAEKE